MKCALCSPFVLYMPAMATPLASYLRSPPELESRPAEPAEAAGQRAAGSPQAAELGSDRKRWDESSYVPRAGAAAEDIASHMAKRSGGNVKLAGDCPIRIANYVIAEHVAITRMMTDRGETIGGDW